MSKLLSQFLRMALAAAAGLVVIPVSAIESVPNTSSSTATRSAASNAFNSLPPEERKKLLAPQIGEFAPTAARKEFSPQDESGCRELERQINRAQYAAPRGLGNTYPEGPLLNKDTPSRDGVPRERFEFRKNVTVTPEGVQIETRNGEVRSGMQQFGAAYGTRSELEHRYRRDCRQ